MSFERKKAVQKANIQNFWLNQECGIFLTKKKFYYRKMKQNAINCWTLKVVIPVASLLIPNNKILLRNGR